MNTSRRSFLGVFAAAASVDAAQARDWSVDLGPQIANQIEFNAWVLSADFDLEKFPTSAGETGS